MANFSTHAIGKVLPSGVEKVSAKGNRFYLQPIELFSHIDEDGFPQSIKEAFFLEKPLPEGRCLLRLEHSQKGATSVTLVRKLSGEQYREFVKLLGGGKPTPTGKPVPPLKEETVFADVSPETRMSELIERNNKEEILFERGGL